MTREIDKQSKVRLKPEIQKWMDEYRKTTGINSANQALADALMEKGIAMMPMPSQEKKSK